MYGRQSTEHALDVVEAAQRVEVVALVVVERRFVAQPPPHRVRVGVDVEVVRVVVEARRSGCRCSYVDVFAQPAGPLGNFSRVPASTRICWPVM